MARSALFYLYRMSKYDLPVKFSENLKIFMKGMKRHVAVKKMEDGDSGIIGKKKMDFKVYEKICELFLPEEGEEFLFAHCFLMLEWNLMARSKSIVHAHFFHIMWEDGCLAFRFAKSKMDQMGRNRDQVWHVYATPNKPCVCPVLALATYILANPSITNVDNFTKTNEDDILVVFSLGVINMGGSWIASAKLLRKIRVCFLHLEFAPVIWDHIPRGRGHAALPW
jgi:hypothetical protein